MDVQVSNGKQDLEIRLNGLEKRYRSSQQESSSLHEITNKLEAEVASKESTIKMLNDKLHNLQQMYEISEKAIASYRQSGENGASHSDSDGNAADNAAAPVEESFRRLEAQLEEKKADVHRVSFFFFLSVSLLGDMVISGFNHRRSIECYWWPHNHTFILNWIGLMDMPFSSEFSWLSGSPRPSSNGDASTLRSCCS